MVFNLKDPRQQHPDDPVRRRVQGAHVANQLEDVVVGALVLAVGVGGRDDRLEDAAEGVLGLQHWLGGRVEVNLFRLLADEVVDLPIVQVRDVVVHQ